VIIRLYIGHGSSSQAAKRTERLLVELPGPEADAIPVCHKLCAAPVEEHGGQRAEPLVEPCVPVPLEVHSLGVLSGAPHHAVDVAVVDAPQPGTQLPEDEQDVLLVVGDPGAGGGRTTCVKVMMGVTKQKCYIWSGLVEDASQAEPGRCVWEHGASPVRVEEEGPLGQAVVIVHNELEERGGLASHVVRDTMLA
jgi:hypothetical protein